MLRAFGREISLGLASCTEGPETDLAAKVVHFVSEKTVTGSNGMEWMQCNFLPLPSVCYTLNLGVCFSPFTIY